MLTSLLLWRASVLWVGWRLGVSQASLYGRLCVSAIHLHSKGMLWFTDGVLSRMDSRTYFHVIYIQHPKLMLVNISSIKDHASNYPHNRDDETYNPAVVKISSSIQSGKATLWSTR